MKPILLPLLLAAACAGRATGPGDLSPVFDPSIPILKKPGGFHLDLLPKAFASDPQIEMTVYSERTEWGRLQPEVTPSAPAYYVVQSQGYQPMGSSPVVEHPPAQEQIDTLLQQVLEKRGFLPARDRQTPPTLALVYYWGSHSGFSMQDVMEQPALYYLRDRDILQRARLVGGRATAAKTARQIAYGIPLTERSAREEHLRYQAENNLYYVVVSAYEFTGLAQNQRRLVWRTTMTVNDVGVSMKETLPPLIISATEFLGRDTDGSVALERRLNRRSVTLGPLLIIGEAAPEQPSPQGN